MNESVNKLQPCQVDIISFILQIRERAHRDYVPMVTNECMEDLGFRHRCV